MTENPIRWFEIYVQDLERSKRFYEAVFECRLTKIENPEIEIWGFPAAKERPGCSGALVHIAGVPSGANSTLVYFGCDDCAVPEARVVAAGGKIHKAKFSIGQYGCISLVHDTEGNLFGLHSMR